MSEEDLQYTTLRKRTRERSVDPGSRFKKAVEKTSVKPPPTDSDNAPDEGWETFKDYVLEMFPCVKFPDEYNDDGIITASVTGILDMQTFLDKFRDIIKLNIQDGRIVIEYDVNKKFKKPVPKDKTNIAVLIFWVIITILTIAFITVNYEKYMKLL